MARPKGTSSGTNFGKSKARNPETNAAQRRMRLSLTAARYIESHYRKSGRLFSLTLPVHPPLHHANHPSFSCPPNLVWQTTLIPSRKAPRRIVADHRHENRNGLLKQLFQ